MFFWNWIEVVGEIYCIDGVRDCFGESFFFWWFEDEGVVSLGWMDYYSFW